jgi:hypothetical protein
VEWWVLVNNNSRQLGVWIRLQASAIKWDRLNRPLFSDNRRQVEVNNLLLASNLPPLGRTSLCLVALKPQPLPLAEHNNKRTNQLLGHLDSVNRLAEIYLAVDSNKQAHLVVNKHQLEGCLDNNNSRLHRLAPVLQHLVSNLRINLL